MFFDTFGQRWSLDWGSNGLEPEKNGKNLDLMIPKLDDGPCHVGLLGVRAAGKSRMPVHVLCLGCGHAACSRAVKKASEAAMVVVDMARTTSFVVQVRVAWRAPLWMTGVGRFCGGVMSLL